MQIISLIMPGELGFVIKTTSRDAVLDLEDGDYEITEEMSAVLREYWPDADLTGYELRVVNG